MGCTVVRESNIAAIERFGKFDRIINSGCHFYNCCSESVEHIRSLQLQSENITIETITKESLSVHIKIGIQYKINDDNFCIRDKPMINLDNTNDDMFALKNPNSYGTISAIPQFQQNQMANNPLYLAIYSCANPLTQIHQQVSSYFRTVCCNFTLNELLLSKNKLTDDLKILLNKEMTRYGYFIHTILILDIDPPKNVKETMNLVLTSQNKRDAMLNEAEAEKKASIMRAEGLCEVRKLEGVGLAQQRQALINGLKNSIGDFCDGQKLDAKELTTTIITMQYLEMLHAAALKGNNTFILSSNPVAANSIEEQMRNALLSTKDKSV